ncbi:hypothetical protein D3C85_1048710 [compost metagenome]
MGAPGAGRSGPDRGRRHRPGSRHRPADPTVQQHHQPDRTEPAQPLRRGPAGERPRRPSERPARRRRHAASDWGDRVDQQSAPDHRPVARQGGAGRFLDLLLHQLRAHHPLCPRLGREVSRSGSGGDRGPHARVRLREVARQCPRRRAPLRHHLSRGLGQRLRHLARVRQQVLAGPLLHRCQGEHPLPPLRRRRLRALRTGHPATAEGGRGHGRRSSRGPSTGSGGRGRRRHGRGRLARNLCRLCAGQELRLARRFWLRRAQDLCDRPADAERLEPVRRLDRARRIRRPSHRRRTPRLPLQGPRPASGHGAQQHGPACPLPRSHRWSGAGR